MRNAVLDKCSISVTVAVNKDLFSRMFHGVVVTKVTSASGWLVASVTDTALDHVSSSPPPS